MKFKPEMTIEELNEKIPWSVDPVWASADISDGWIKLVSRLVDDLNEMDCSYTVAQVKEKFGGLRFYHDPAHAAGCGGVDNWNDCPLAQRIAIVEEESYNVCEKCGGKAEPTDRAESRFGRWGSYCKRCK